MLLEIMRWFGQLPDYPQNHQKRQNKIQKHQKKIQKHQKRQKIKSERTKSPLFPMDYFRRNAS